MYINIMYAILRLLWILLCFRLKLVSIAIAISVLKDKVYTNNLINKNINLYIIFNYTNPVLGTYKASRS